MCLKELIYIMPQGTLLFWEVTLMTNTLRLGQTVRNLGILAKVAGFHETTGDPILRPFYNDGSRWLASADKCEPVTEAPAPLTHREGLAALG
jgi:hypothetical protein